MKARTPEQLKGQVNSFAKRRGLQPQEILQMFFFERVLDRLSRSEYAEKLILKGGLLISSMLGVEERTTMDMDTTVVGVSMDENVIRAVITEILAIDVGDGIEFEFIKLEPIREDDDYNNFRAYFKANYGKISNDMKIDVTTGDAITPAAIDYSYRTILDGDIIPVKTYNKETILAEKYETIIRINVGTTRARDFYDLYMFFSLHKADIDIDVLKAAVSRTSKRRGSETDMNEWKEVCDDIKTDSGLQQLWANYQKNNQFASEIPYETIMESLIELGTVINKG